MSAAIAYGAILSKEDREKVYRAVEDEALSNDFDIHNGILYYLPLCWWADGESMDISLDALQVTEGAKAAFAALKGELGLSDFTPAWVLFSM